jgi:hypothetical protein
MPIFLLVSFENLSKLVGHRVDPPSGSISVAELKKDVIETLGLSVDVQAIEIYEANDPLKKQLEDEFVVVENEENLDLDVFIRIPHIIYIISDRDLWSYTGTIYSKNECIDFKMLMEVIHYRGQQLTAVRFLNCIVSFDSLGVSLVPTDHLFRRTATCVYVEYFPEFPHWLLNMRKVW